MSWDMTPAAGLRQLILLVLLCGLVLKVIVHSFSSYFDLNVKEYVPKSMFRLPPINYSYEETMYDTDLIDIEPSSLHSNDEIQPDEYFEDHNLPSSFWSGRNKLLFVKGTNCASFPKLSDIEFNSDYWQVLQLEETFLFANAYYDNRIQGIDVHQERKYRGPCVRIVGMINSFRPTSKPFCQLWFEDMRNPVFTDGIKYQYMWIKKWGFRHTSFQPFLFTCHIPWTYRLKIPIVVSVVRNLCDTATNALRVIYNKPLEKKEFAVCVKGLDYFDLDISVRLVEWIELLGILGADTIFFYSLNVHPNISKVLQYYQNLGRVRVTHFPLPGEQPNFPLLQHSFITARSNILKKRHHEVVMYNDCLYKNLYSYKYIVLLDVDEVIMPIRSRSWNELAEHLEEKKADSICGRVAYFLDRMVGSSERFRHIPKYMHMLQHVFRIRDFSKIGFYAKCFHKPNNLIVLHNHLPISCFRKCVPISLDVSQAVVQHFRKDCGKRTELCREYPFLETKDTVIWRFKKELIKKTINVLKKLDFL